MKIPNVMTIVDKIERQISDDAAAGGSTATAAAADAETKTAGDLDASRKNPAAEKSSPVKNRSNKNEAAKKSSAVEESKAELKSLPNKKYEGQHKDDNSRTRPREVKTGIRRGAGNQQGGSKSASSATVHRQEAGKSSPSKMESDTLIHSLGAGGKYSSRILALAHKGEWSVLDQLLRAMEKAGDEINTPDEVFISKISFPLPNHSLD